MKITVFIVSGVSKGLGYALVEKILSYKSNNFNVIGISRTEPDFTIKFPNKFKWVYADFKNPQKTLDLIEFTLKNYNPYSLCFINNAGDINPIESVGKIDNKKLKDSVSVNILSPAIFINFLINHYSKIPKLILVNITSGAANKAIKGWSLYCSAKAFMKMYFNVIEAELINNQSNNIVIKQIDPGAMNTEMQGVIRSAIIESEQYHRLKEMHMNNELKQPEDVAEIIIKDILIETSNFV